MTRGEVRYGTAGWSFQDWHGPFYPARRPERDEGPGALFGGRPAAAPDPDLALVRRDPLAWYARWFDLVEVNVSFYRIPDPGVVERWCRTTARPGGERPFLFTFKLPQAFTHERRLDPGEVAAFRACLDPVAATGRLAGLLAQFPHAYRWDAKTARHLERLAATCDQAPLVVEVRNRTWEDPQALDHLRGLGLSLANIDQPPVDDSILPPAARVTAPGLAYVRLHGRNVRAWFARDAGRDARYDYLYSPEELLEWGERIELLSGMAERTLVIANNHYRGQAPANALELRRLREGPEVRVPSTLLASFPRLARVRPAG